ncbi:uncharacterized protein LOC125045492 [Penaeus chinensis]|uniref:uncharacterized protein LOC125045492 n=1 Tax=Penaeus chinensis TaxID=139456 RepID=UPI001FB686AC|nr:uncharacterized protein LOC125045492 [Penaeus chinensis]XP_047498737.1 uncharacterized protein LOC125045492 [Penaeus chinensis]XP_047498738.1 uncharacterized protein LOC125045492 [Penaeus chinensis]XP_047498739.1 uncharacterized protein LOC125045492 [Penaeus chinensis]
MALECSECGKQFTNKEALNKHMLMHTWETLYSCEQCGENFSQKVSLKKHMICHGDKKTFKCEICGSVYSANKNLKRHLKTCGSTGSLSKTKCLHPSCEKRFFHVTKMIHHLESHHSGMKVEVSEFHFQSLSDFTEWKEEEEHRTHTFFSRASGKTYLKGAVYWYFTCQHDGSARFHCKKGEAGRLTNRKWMKGRVKTGLTCPSRIMARQFNDGRVSVKYISTHSHDVIFENRKFQPLSGRLLSMVKQQLANGIAPKEIQKNLQKGFALNNDGVPKKDHLVTLKQLNQLKRKLWQKSQPRLSDLCSLVSLVSKLKESPLDPVIVYKPDGQNIVCGNSNLADLPHSLELVTIGLQTEEQLRVIKDNVLRIVSIVPINWFSEMDICMLSLVVPDDCGSGHPIAHFITNYVDEATLRCLFLSLLERCPLLKINAIMTDENNFGLNALRSVFGDSRHLLCQGHTRRNWQEKLQKLINCDKTRYEVSAILDMLLYEREEETFKQMCYTFIESYGKTCSAFIEFFCEHYLDRQLKWASCFRKLPEGGFDSMEYGEAFKSRLKSCQRERNCANAMCNFVLTLLALEQGDSVNTIDCRRQQIDKTNRHTKGMQIPDSIVSQESGVWKITDRNHCQGFYYVTKIADVCREDLCFQKCLDLSCAGLCSHLYVCDCEDMAGLCSHVHKIHSMEFRKQSALKSEQDIYYEHEQEVYCRQEEVVYGEQEQKNYSKEPEHSIYIAQEMSLKQEPELYYEQEIFIEQEQEICSHQKQNLCEQVLVYEENFVEENVNHHYSEVETMSSIADDDKISRQEINYKIEKCETPSSEHEHSLAKEGSTSDAIFTNINRLKCYMKDPKVKKILLSNISGTMNKLVMHCEAVSPESKKLSPSSAVAEGEVSSPSITLVDCQSFTPSVSVVHPGDLSSGTV